MSAPILIAGPTASGKSALALGLAARIGPSLIVNADSMQVYDGWRILSARPTLEEEAQAPHALFGHVDPAESYSVGAWLRDLYPVLRDARAEGLTPIVVGGTGLYFTSLVRGLSLIPEVDESVKAEAEDLLEKLGRRAFHAKLLERDPKASGVDPMNPRRLLRAWEVFEQTGKSLADWAAETPPPLLPLGQTRTAVVLEADPDWLRERIDRRFERMMKDGAPEEVRTMIARGLPSTAPALKAHGAPALTDHLMGGMGIDAAIREGQADTRRYAKRQRTWFRNQMGDWPRIPAGDGALDAMMAHLDKIT